MEFFQLQSNFRKTSLIVNVSYLVLKSLLYVLLLSILRVAMQQQILTRVLSKLSWAVIVGQYPGAKRWAFA